MNDDRRAATTFLLFVVACVLVMAWWLGPCARPAHPAPALYTPMLYDEFTVPNGPCLDDYCYPRILYWADGPLHNLNLVGVPFAFLSPKIATWPALTNPRAAVGVIVNFWGHVEAPPALGDSMDYSGFMVEYRTLLGTFTTDSLITLKRGRAFITSAAGDSILEGRAYLVVGNPLWPADDSLTYHFRLVPESYRRAGFAGGQP